MTTFSSPDNARRRLSQGGRLNAFGLTSPSVGAAQVLAHSGADVLIVDMEHGCVELRDAQAIMSAELGPRCSCFVRIPLEASWLVKPVLDGGASGIVFPMVRSAAELAGAIARTKYFPAGTRAIGPHTAPSRWGLSTSEYMSMANDALFVGALIETREAVDDIEAIVKLQGLDAATIGLGDLAASLGHPGDTAHPVVMEAVAHVEAAVLASPVALGGVAMNPRDIAEKKTRGYRLLVLAFDVGLLSSAAAVLISAANQQEPTT